MARVSDIELEHTSGRAHEIYARIQGEYGPFGNMLRVFAHRPPALEHIFGLLLDSKADALISKRHLEIVLVAASAANACAYCVSHHAPRLIAEGLPAEAADRILEAQVPGFDALDHLVRDYAVQVSRDARRVSDALFEGLRAHFSEAQVVELTVRAALCAFFSRFNEALRIDVEEDVLALELTPPDHSVAA